MTCGQQVSYQLYWLKGQGHKLTEPRSRSALASDKPSLSGYYHVDSSSSDVSHQRTIKPALECLMTRRSYRLLHNTLKKAKSGVDVLEKLVRTYNTCKYTSFRWTVTILLNTLDTAAYNAFVLLITANAYWQRGKPHRRRLFLHVLGTQLLRNHASGCCSTTTLHDRPSG